jgi:hypothetical protein
MVTRASRALDLADPARRRAGSATGEALPTIGGRALGVPGVIALRFPPSSGETAGIENAYCVAATLSATPISKLTATATDT